MQEVRWAKLVQLLDFDVIRLQLESELSLIVSTEALEALRVRYFGKSGLLTAARKAISEIGDIAKKREYGAVVNSFCGEVESLIAEYKAKLAISTLRAQLASEKVDISLPARERRVGKIHPISYVLSEVKQIFAHLGFQLADGPELEDEWHVFDALNTPAHHPARSTRDTFYLRDLFENKRVVLRTHTSSVQIREMQKISTPPLRIIAPGRVYRNDWDATHSPMFHQIEGLCVDEGVNMGHLKFCINYFLRNFFHPGIHVRFRNSFFPFTEPSAEVDISYDGRKWIEILGCGMTHPQVLQNVGVDSRKYTAFAFGLGVERVAMLKYNIPDLRDLYVNNQQWLRHYGFDFTEMGAT